MTTSKPIARRAVAGTPVLGSPLRMLGGRAAGAPAGSVLVRQRFGDLQR